MARDIEQRKRNDTLNKFLGIATDVMFPHRIKEKAAKTFLESRTGIDIDTGREDPVQDPKKAFRLEKGFTKSILGSGISIGSLLGVPTEESDIMRQGLEKALPTDTGLEQLAGRFAGQLAPSTLPVLSPAASMERARKLSTGFMTAQAMGIGREEVQRYEQRTGKELSPLTEGLAAAGYGLVVHWSEKAELNWIIGQLRPETAVKLLGAFAKARKTGVTAEAARVLNIATVEMGQEAGEQWSQNFIDRMLFDPDQKLLEGVGGSAKGGFVGGGFLGSLVTGRRVFFPETLPPLSANNNLNNSIKSTSHQPYTIMNNPTAPPEYTEAFGWDVVGGSFGGNLIRDRIDFELQKTSIDPETLVDRSSNAIQSLSKVSRAVRDEWTRSLAVYQVLQPNATPEMVRRLESLRDAVNLLDKASEDLFLGRVEQAPDAGFTVAGINVIETEESIFTESFGTFKPLEFNKFVRTTLEAARDHLKDLPSRGPIRGREEKMLDTAEQLILKAEKGEVTRTDVGKAFKILDAIFIDAMKALKVEAEALMGAESTDVDAVLTRQEDINQLSRNAVNINKMLQLMLQTSMELTDPNFKGDINKKVEHTLGEILDLVDRTVFPDPFRDSPPDFQQKLWQGTGARFTAADFSFIGTGEGGAALGWGMYFTEEGNVARVYRDLFSTGYAINGVAQEALTKESKLDNPVHENVVDEVQNAIKQDKKNLGSVDVDGVLIGIIEELKEEIEGATNKARVRDVEAVIADLEALRKAYRENPDSIIAVGGHVLEATIHQGRDPSEYEYLRWDKEVPQEQLDKILTQLGKENSEVAGEFRENLEGQKTTGKRIYRDLQHIVFKGSDKEASLFLLRAGIDGTQASTGFLSRGIKPAKVITIGGERTGIKSKDIIPKSTETRVEISDIDVQKEIIKRLNKKAEGASRKDQQKIAQIKKALREDPSSVSSDSETFNFVVFDENAIVIDKYIEDYQKRLGIQNNNMLTIAERDEMTKLAIATGLIAGFKLESQQIYMVPTNRVDHNGNPVFDPGIDPNESGAQKANGYLDSEGFVHLSPEIERNTIYHELGEAYLLAIGYDNATVTEALNSFANNDKEELLNILGDYILAKPMPKGLFNKAKAFVADLFSNEEIDRKQILLDILATGMMNYKGQMVVPGKMKAARQQKTQAFRDVLQSLGLSDTGSVIDSRLNAALQNADYTSEDVLRRKETLVRQENAAIDQIARKIVQDPTLMGVLAEDPDILHNLINMQQELILDPERIPEKLRAFIQEHNLADIRQERLAEDRNTLPSPEEIELIKKILVQQQNRLKDIPDTAGGPVLTPAEMAANLQPVIDTLAAQATSKKVIPDTEQEQAAMELLRDPQQVEKLLAAIHNRIKDPKDFLILDPVGVRAFNMLINGRLKQALRNTLIENDQEAIEGLMSDINQALHDRLNFAAEFGRGLRDAQFNQTPRQLVNEITTLYTSLTPEERVFFQTIQDQINSSQKAVRKQGYADLKELVNSKLGKPAVADLLVDAVVTYMLSNPATIGLNAIGTAMWMAWLIPKKAIGAKLDAMLTGAIKGRERQVYVEEVSKKLLSAGIKKGSTKGWKKAKQILETGFLEKLLVVDGAIEGRWATEFGSGATESFRRADFKNKTVTKALNMFGSIVDAKWVGPSRLMRASDIYLKTIAFEVGMRQQAVKYIKKNPTHAASLQNRFKRDLTRISTTTKISMEQALIELIARHPRSKGSGPNARVVLGERRGQRLINDAAMFANYATFQDKPDRITGGFLKFRNSVDVGLGIGRWGIPFVNTIVNLAKRGIELTPGAGIPLLFGVPGITRGRVGRGKDLDAAEALILQEEANVRAARKTKKEDAIKSAQGTLKEAIETRDKALDRASEGGTDTLSEAIAIQMGGAIMAAAFLSMFDDDDITGPMPMNAREKQAYYENGIQPYSFRAGGSYINYRMYEPFGSMFAYVGMTRHAILERMDKGDVEGAESLFVMLATDMARTFIDSTWVGNVDRLTTSHGIESHLTDIPQNFIPYNQFNRAMYRAMQSTFGDGVRVQERDTNLFESVGAATEGNFGPIGELFENRFSGMMPEPITSFIGLEKTPKLTVWGEEVILRRGEEDRDNKLFGIVPDGFQHWLPVKWSQPTNDPVEIELYKLKAYPLPPTNKASVAGVEFELPDDIHRDMALIAGKRLKKELDRYMSGKRYENLQDNVKKMEAIKLIQRIVYDKARNQALREYKKQLGAADFRLMVIEERAKKAD